jgi:GNAT superfamily N-acetyltransferase
MSSVDAPPSDVEADARSGYRPLRADETRYAARLHARALPHGFFVDLGPRFLAAYYETFVRSPHAVALGGELDGDLAGVLVGTRGNGAHYRWVVRNAGVRLAVLAVAGMLVRPRVLAHFVRTRVGRYLRGLRRLRNRSSEIATEPRGPVAVLSHVSVEPHARGAGVGGVLVDAFLAEARAAGAAEAMLVTLAGEHGAGAFYSRRGWTHDGDRDDHDGRSISAYRMVLDE